MRGAPLPPPPSPDQIEYPLPPLPDQIACGGARSPQCCVVVAHWRSATSRVLPGPRPVQCMPAAVIACCGAHAAPDVWGSLRRAPTLRSGRGRGGARAAFRQAPTREPPPIPFGFAFRTSTRLVPSVRWVPARHKRPMSCPHPSRQHTHTDSTPLVLQPQPQPLPLPPSARAPAEPVGFRPRNRPQHCGLAQGASTQGCIAERRRDAGCRRSTVAAPSCCMSANASQGHMSVQHRSCGTVVGCAGQEPWCVGGACTYGEQQQPRMGSPPTMNSLFAVVVMM